MKNTTQINPMPVQQKIPAVPRYEKILQKQARIRQQLIVACNVDEAQWNADEFDLGMKLIDLYLGDGGNAKHIEKALLTNKEIGFWRWFSNQKALFEWVFWSKYSESHRNDAKDIGKIAAGDALYAFFMRKINIEIKSMELHERLRSFIIQNIKLIYKKINEYG